jgi:hypothetical protein
MKAQRWPAEIITYTAKRPKGEAAPEYNIKVDYDPQSGSPRGFMIWRSDKTDQAIDRDLYEISTKTSRLMQRRAS